MIEPRYIVYVNTRQFYLCGTLVDALDRKRDFGGLVYEPLAMSTAEKVNQEDEVSKLRKLVKTLLANLKNVRVNGDYGGVPLWSVVGNLMGLGSTSATELCKEFGVDPHQLTNDWSDIPKEE